MEPQVTEAVTTWLGCSQTEPGDTVGPEGGGAKWLQPGHIGLQPGHTWLRFSAPAAETRRVGR
jgi:hypothetical protein